MTLKCVKCVKSQQSQRFDVLSFCRSFLHPIVKCCHIRHLYECSLLFQMEKK